MKLLAPEDRDLSIPITITVLTDPAGPRLGGRAPANASPSRFADRAEYFATVPLTADYSLLASVFIGFDLDGSLELSGDLKGGSRVVEVVAHTPSGMRSDDLYASTLGAHGLLVSVARHASVIWYRVATAI